MVTFLQILLVVAALGVATVPGVWVVQGVLRLSRRRPPAGSAPTPAVQQRPAQTATDPTAANPTEADPTAAGGPAVLDPAQVLRGGLVIGVLERAITVAAVLLGHPELIAMVIAVKGLGRYPELRASSEHGLSGPAVSERFIIGTLVSLVWAAAVALAAHWALLTLA